MDLEEHSLEPMLERSCEVCGVALTRAEIEAAQDVNGPFLCTVHSAEELPTAGEDELAAPGDTG